MSVLVGDCRVRMAELPACSVDAVVTDPPYGLEFMGKEWDAFGRGGAQSHATAGTSKPGIGERTTEWPSFLGGLNPRCQVCTRSMRGGSPCRCEVPDPSNERLPRLRGFQAWCEEWATEALRVLKPGGHLLAFGGTRTYHRLACAIEDAGFEVRDTLAWMYGSGFPKSLDVSKAIDRAARAQREVVGSYVARGFSTVSPTEDGRNQWAAGEVVDKVGTRTAPATPDAEAWDGWGTALKPAYEPIVVARKPLAGTVAGNVLVHGTGALNIDGCRVDTGGEPAYTHPNGPLGNHDNGTLHRTRLAEPVEGSPLGRWPANVILDEEAGDMLDAQSGVTTAGAAGAKGSSGFVDGYDGTYDVPYGDTGGASRFFYCAKANGDERPEVEGIRHPTVKPLALMRWLVRLVTPPGGTVLDPFLGSGTTAEAALLEGFGWLGCERTEEYLPLIQARLDRFAAGRSPGLPQTRTRPPEVEGQGVLAL